MSQGDDKCPICFDVFTSLSRFSDCKHTLCTDCASKLLEQKKCMLCRKVQEIKHFDSKGQEIEFPQICITCNFELICNIRAKKKHETHNIIEPNNGIIKINYQFTFNNNDKQLQDIVDMVANKGLFFSYSQNDSISKFIRFLVQTNSVTFEIDKLNLSDCIKNIPKNLKLVEHCSKFQDFDNLINKLILNNYEYLVQTEKFYDYTKQRIYNFKGSYTEKIIQVVYFVNEFGSNYINYTDSILKGYFSPIQAGNNFWNFLYLFKQCYQPTHREYDINSIICSESNTIQRISSIYKLFNIDQDQLLQKLFHQNTANPIYIAICQLISMPSIQEFFLINSSNLEGQLMNIMGDLVKRVCSGEKIITLDLQQIAHQFNGNIMNCLNTLSALIAETCQKRQNSDFTQLKGQINLDQLPFSVECIPINFIIDDNGYPRQVAQLPIPKTFSSDQIITFLQKTLKLNEDQPATLASLIGEEFEKIRNFKYLYQELQTGGMNINDNQQFILYQNYQIQTKNQIPIYLHTVSGYQITYPHLMSIDNVNTIEDIKKTTINSYKAVLIELLNMCENENMANPEIDVDALELFLEHYLDFNIKIIRNGIQVQSINENFQNSASQFKIYILIKNIFECISKADIFQILHSLKVYNPDIESILAVQDNRVRQTPSIITLNFENFNGQTLKDFICVNNAYYKLRGAMSLGFQCDSIICCGVSQNEYFTKNSEESEFEKKQIQGSLSLIDQNNVIAFYEKDECSLAGLIEMDLIVRRENRYNA